MSIWRPLNPSVQTVKRLPARRETWVRSLGQEDPLEKEMATHSSILAWRIPWMEEPGALQSTGSQRVRHDWATSLTHSLTRNKVTVSRIHGSPLQNLFNVHLYLFYLVDTFMTLSMSFLCRPVFVSHHNPREAGTATNCYRWGPWDRDTWSYFL